MSQTTQPKRPTPKWYALIAIGLFNGSGNFCMAIAQPHTPGLTQSLLFLLGIPLVLFISFLFLRKKPSLIAIGGAAIIVAGTMFSSFRSVPIFGGKGDSGSIKVFWYSVVLFAVAQIFLAGEKVFEEFMFRATKVDVMSMFCWTMWTQFFLGFALYPLQSLKPFGGLVLSKLPMVMKDGILCNFGIPSNLTIDIGPGTTQVDCNWVNPTLFFTYCIVDFTCYGFGLFVIDKGGANLLVIASSIALPLQQFVLYLPFLGKYTETFFWGDAIALVLVMLGFLVFQLLSREGKIGRGLDPDRSRLCNRQPNEEHPTQSDCYE